MLEETERHERGGDARLEGEEDPEEDDRPAEQAERLRGRPAVAVPVHDRVDGQHERGRDRDRAPDVEPRLARRAAGGGEEDDAEGEDRDSDRDVDEEDPVPGQEIREDPAEEHADGASAGRDEAEDAHRLRAVSGFGEESHDQRERDCRDDRAAEALDRARGDEQALRGGEPACERGDREERDTREEHLPMPVEVAKASCQKQEASECQQVGVDDPRERGLREAEILTNRRQRDVHDRRVEHDHQISETENDECDPAPAVVQGHGFPYTERRGWEVVNEPLGWRHVPKHPDALQLRARGER